jgi:hypothetical protein
LALQAGLINPAVENRSFQRIANLLSPAAHSGSGSCHGGFLNTELQPALSFREVAPPTRGGMFDWRRVAHAQGASSPIIHRLEYKDTQSFSRTVVPIRNYIPTTGLLRDFETQKRRYLFLHDIAARLAFVMHLLGILLATRGAVLENMELRNLRIGHFFMAQFLFTRRHCVAISKRRPTSFSPLHESRFDSKHADRRAHNRQTRLNLDHPIDLISPLNALIPDRTPTA